MERRMRAAQPTAELIPIWLLCLTICPGVGLCNAEAKAQPEVSAVPLRSVSILEVANVTSTELQMPTTMITESGANLSPKREDLHAPEFAKPADPDEVISSSEILDNQPAGGAMNFARQDAPASGRKQEEAGDHDKHSYSQYNHQNPTTGDSDDSLRFVGNSASSSSTFGSEDETSSSSSSSRTNLTTSQQLVSRYLLQSLTLGLLILVSLSLALIYSLKFCLCRKRKLHRRAARWPMHLLRQHNLVSDSTGAHHPQAERLAHELLFGSAPDTCTCLNVSTLRAMAAASGAPTPQLRYQSLLAPSLWTPQSNSNDSIRSPGELVYQQLALAERLALHNEQTMLSNMINRPPAYSELFTSNQQQETQLRHDIESSSTQSQRPEVNSTPGCVHQRNVSPLVSSSDDTCDLPTTSHNLNTTLETSDTSGYICSGSHLGANGISSDSDDHCDIRVDRVASCSNGGGGGSPSGRNSRQNNLLVKLNLNKTRLLSPDDLVLLSKLIDVPIVVQDGASMTTPPTATTGLRPSNPSTEDERGESTRRQQDHELVREI